MTVKQTNEVFLVFLFPFKSQYTYILKYYYYKLLYLIMFIIV